MEQIRLSYHKDTAGTLVQCQFVIKDSESSMFPPNREFTEGLTEPGPVYAKVYPLNQNNVMLLSDLLDYGVLGRIQDGG